MTDIDALADLYIFRSVVRADIEALCALAPPRTYEPHTTLFVQGEVAVNALLVVSGRLRATVQAGGKTRPVGEIGPGEIVGEQALFNVRGVRSATITALQTSRALIITPRLLQDSAHNTAVLALETYLLGSLARRIRSTNRTLLQAWKEAGPKSSASQATIRAAAKATTEASGNLLDSLRRLFGG